MTKTRRKGHAFNGIRIGNPSIQPLQTYTLDRPAARIVLRWHVVVKSEKMQMFPRAVGFASQACYPVFPSSIVIICT
jgi:hypothetical protein